MYTPDYPISSDNPPKSTPAPEPNPSLDPNPMAPTAEDQLDAIRARLEEMYALAARSADDATTDEERQALQKELDRLREQIDNIAGEMNS